MLSENDARLCLVRFRYRQQNRAADLWSNEMASQLTSFGDVWSNLLPTLR